jgi:hypothetical protein
MGIARGWPINTMTNWAYAEISGPIILTGAGALMIICTIGRRGELDRRDESVQRYPYANIGHYAT